MYETFHIHCIYSHLFLLALKNSLCTYLPFPNDDSMIDSLASPHRGDIGAPVYLVQLLSNMVVVLFDLLHLKHSMFRGFSENSTNLQFD